MPFRSLPPEGDGKLSKEESHALDRRQRNLALQLKNRREQMLLAKTRGELIERKLVQLQASFLLTAMRRQAMALPQAYCDRLAAAGDPLEVKAILVEAMRGLLTEVQDLPNRIDAEEWQRFLGEQEAGAGEPVAKAGKQEQASAPKAKAKQKARER